MLRVRLLVELNSTGATTTNVSADRIMIDGTLVEPGRVYRETVRTDVWHTRDAPEGDPGQKETWSTNEVTGYLLTVYGEDLEEAKKSLLEAPVGLEEVIRALTPKPDEFPVELEEDRDPARLHRTGSPDGTSPMTMSDIVTVELKRG